MATPAQLDQLTSTLNALQGNLFKVTDDAKNAVGGWLDTLRGNADLAPVAEQLGRLQDAIAQNHSGTIADSLSTLSEQTKAAAVKATPDAQIQLYELSDLLKMIAGQVGW